MSVTVTVAPTAEPVTLAEARAHLRLDHNDEDGLLAGYLLAARQHIEGETRRALSQQTLQYRIDRDWPTAWIGGASRDGIALPRAPLRSVVGIEYVDPVGDTQTLPASQYQVARANDSKLEGLILPAYGVTWPRVREQFEAITVTFVAGYGGSLALPEPLRQAILLLTAHFYENREPVNVGNIVTEIPLTVASLVFPYRVLG
jgi:uncharacterized phiE125 gp8 family phage protein